MCRLIKKYEDYEDEKYEEDTTGCPKNVKINLGKLNLWFKLSRSSGR